MKILVTGGSGFLGSHVADELTNNGHKVIIYDLLKSKWLKKNQKFIKGNITDTKKLSRLISGTDIVYNFAALGDLDKARFMPIETVNYNILSLVNMLKLSKKFKIKRFVQASSVYADSEEGGFYGRSKRAAEDYMVEFDKTFTFPYTILRFGSLYGPRADDNNGIKKLIKSAKTKKKIIYRGNKMAVRRYIHVKDAAKLSVQILSSRYKNKILTITGKKSIKVYNLMKFLSNKLKLKIKNNLFLNEKNTAHYKNKPTPLKRKKGTNIFIKKEKNFKESILELLK
jgi:UDP-glucose 4-epimerase